MYIHSYETATRANLSLFVSKVDARVESATLPVMAGFGANAGPRLSNR